MGGLEFTLELDAEHVEVLGSHLGLKIRKPFRLGLNLRPPRGLGLEEVKGGGRGGGSENIGQQDVKPPTGPIKPTVFLVESNRKSNSPTLKPLEIITPRHRPLSSRGSGFLALWQVVLHVARSVPLELGTPPAECAGSQVPV